jgi:hypothetical protein
MKQKLHIVVGETPATTMVLLDGKPMENVRRIAFEADASKPDAGFVTLDIFCEGIIDGEFAEIERVRLSTKEPQE